jgi:hypothetical protein
MYYKIRIKIYNSLNEIDKMNYLLDCEILLDPYREDYWY